MCPALGRVCPTLTRVFPTQIWREHRQGGDAGVHDPRISQSPTYDRSIRIRQSRSKPSALNQIWRDNIGKEVTRVYMGKPFEAKVFWGLGFRIHCLGSRVSGGYSSTGRCQQRWSLNPQPSTLNPTPGLGFSFGFQVSDFGFRFQVSGSAGRTAARPCAKTRVYIGKPFEAKVPPRESR